MWDAGISRAAATGLYVEGLMLGPCVTRPTFRSASLLFSCPRKSQRVYNSIPTRSARSSAVLNTQAFVSQLLDAVQPTV